MEQTAQELIDESETSKHNAEDFKEWFYPNKDRTSHNSKEKPTGEKLSSKKIPYGYKFVYKPRVITAEEIIKEVLEK